MGNQQIIMIVLGTIVVAIAVAVGISMFHGYYNDSLATEMESALMEAATFSIEKFHEPKTLGGLAGSMSGFTLPHSMAKYAGFTVEALTMTPSIIIFTATSDKGLIRLTVQRKGGPMGTLSSVLTAPDRKDPNMQVDAGEFLGSYSGTGIYNDRHPSPVWFSMN